MANILSDFGAQGSLTDLSQAASGIAGILNGAKLSFFTTNIGVVSTTPLVSFVVSADANLSSLVLTWGASYRLLGGGFAKDAGAILAQLADAANAGPLYGYVVENPGETEWIYAELFDNPITLNDVLDGFYLLPSFAMGGGTFGGGAVIR